MSLAAAVTLSTGTGAEPLREEKPRLVSSHTVRPPLCNVATVTVIAVSPAIIDRTSVPCFEATRSPKGVRTQNHVQACTSRLERRGDGGATEASQWWRERAGAIVDLHPIRSAVSCPLQRESGKSQLHALPRWCCYRPRALQIVAVHIER